MPLQQQSIKRINVRLTEDEYETFKKRRDSVQSKDMSEFIRAVLLDKPLPTKAPLSTYQTDLISQLGEIRDDILRIGVNINQSAKRINSTTDYQDLQRETAMLSGKVKTMHSQLNALIVQLTCTAKSVDGGSNQ